MAKRKPDYTPLPAVPEMVVPRLTAVLAVLSGLKTVSQAARELGLSRNRFQSLMHRALSALVAQLILQPAGRPAKPPALLALEAELRRLQRENAKLQSQVGSTERLLEVASGLLQGRIRTSGRQRRSRSGAGSARDGGEESEPDAHRRMLLEQVDAMRRLKLPTPCCARLAGVGASTLRRWHARHACGLPLTVRGDGSADGTIAAEHVIRAQALVRGLHGLVGAAALSHSVSGLSRRQAAGIKRLTVSAMEAERKAALIRIRITVPGVLRGIDAMQIVGRHPRYALIAADGAVPYRTSVTVGPHYDSELVVRALTQDLQQHGAPLVYRLDRARCHDTPPVRALLAAHRVLVLHGPPHHPGYYGQLERQNREHRAWLRDAQPADDKALAACLPDMLDGVNRLWRRRSLGWRTAAEAWQARPPLTIDRQALHEEVTERALRIARTLSGRGQTTDLAERLAIEQTLTRIGYLRQELGGWC